MMGQLVVTPEVAASKINNMKENKSPGVSRWDITNNTERNCRTN